MGSVREVEEENIGTKKKENQPTNKPRKKEEKERRPSEKYE